MNYWRIALFTALCFVSGHLAAQEAPKRVTFRRDAGTASSVLPELGKAIGVSISAEGPIAGSVVLIQVKDAPLDEVLARIARVTTGSWQRREGTYVLVLDADRARDEQRTELVERAAGFKKAMEQPLLDGSGHELRLNGARAAISKLLPLIGPAKLAALELDSRTVFAFPATNAQVALPKGAVRIANEAVGESVPNPNILSKRSFDNQTTSRVIAKTHLIVTRPYEYGGLVIVLKVANADGQSIISDSSFLEPLFAPARCPIEVQNPSQTIELGERSKFIAKSLATTGYLWAGTPGYYSIGPSVNVFKSQSAPSAVKDVVTNPDKYDPLAFVVGEALSKLADVERCDLIACLPDSSLVPAARTLEAGQITAEEMVRSAVDSWDLTIEVGGGRLSVAPAHPASARAARMNRPSLAQAMQLLATQGFLNLDQKAAYAAQQQPADFDQTFEIAYLKLLSPPFANYMQNTLRTGERRMLRFYHGLPAGQRQALAAGQSVAIGTLALQAHRLVLEMTYHMATNLIVGVGIGMVVHLTQPNNGFCEPTEVFWNGVPATGSLSMRTEPAKAVFAVGENGEKTNVSLGLQSATVTWGQPWPQSTCDITQYAKYQVGESTSYTFTFRLTPDVLFTKTLVDDRVDPLSETLAYGGLPKWYRQQVERLREEARQVQDRAGSEHNPPATP